MPIPRATRLTTDYHRRGPTAVPCHSHAIRHASTHQSTTLTRPEGPDPATVKACFHVLDRTVPCRYGTINPFIHSTTPVGLALGPDSPGDDERGPGTLGHPADGIVTRLSLLMSAFSLPYGPRRVYTAASPLHGTLSYPAISDITAASSVACLSPATLSARNH